MGHHHETLPPSSYPAWAQCPHWEAMQGDSKVASEGTQQHELLRLALDGDIDLDTTEDVDKGMLYIIRRATREIKQSIARVFGDKGYSISTELEVTSIALPEQPFGTADVIAVSDDGDQLMVIDYKSFFTEKEYKEQLAFYAYAYCERQRIDPEHITLAVYYGDTGTMQSFKPMNLEEVRNIAIGAIGKRLNKANEPRKASPWCGLCANCGQCQSALSLVDKGQAIIPIDTSIALPMERIAPMLTVCSELEKRIKAFREYAKGVAEQMGGIILDANGTVAYELKQSKTSKVNIRELFEVIRTMVTPQELLGACSITKTAIKSLLKGRLYDGAPIKVKRIDEIIDSVSIEGEPTIKLQKVAK